MNRFVNWKSLTLAVTIIGVLVPVWIWRADLNSRSLIFRVASQTSLQPDAVGSIAGLQVVVDGTPLRSPYLSVIELSNDGEKPILSSEFEAPLELRISDGSTLARAQVAESKPKDIEAALEIEGQIVKIKPLLLNPKDAVTISILTAGSKPQFSVKARIAGISTVSVFDGAGRNSQIQSGITVVAFFASLLMLIASNITGVNWTTNEPVFLRKRAAILVSTTTGIIAIALFLKVLDSLGITGIWHSLLAITLLLAVSIPLGVLWNWSTTNSRQG